MRNENHHPHFRAMVQLLMSAAAARNGNEPRDDGDDLDVDAEGPKTVRSFPPPPAGMLAAGRPR